jgi:integrase
MSWKKRRAIEPAKKRAVKTVEKKSRVSQKISAAGTIMWRQLRNLIRTKAVTRPASPAELIRAEPRPKARVTVAKDADQPTRVILLPPRGLRAEGPSSRGVGDFMVSMHLAAMRASETIGANWADISSREPIPITLAPELQLRIVDAVAENGAKLVEIRPSALSRLRAAQPGLRVAPLIQYELAMPHRTLSVRSRLVRRTGAIQIRSRSPLAGRKAAGGRMRGRLFAICRSRRR